MDLLVAQCIRILTLLCFLTSTLLLTAAAPISLRTDTLECFFCRLKFEPCSDPITTQCAPDEVCATSEGSELTTGINAFGQGCIKRDKCGSHERIKSDGLWYNVSHTCCCENKCNSWQSVGKEWLEILLEMMLGVIKGAKQDKIVKDSCANYTAPPMDVKAPK